MAKTSGGILRMNGMIAGVLEMDGYTPTRMRTTPTSSRNCNLRVLFRLPASIGISGARDVSDWFIYRRIRAMTIRWHPRLGDWRLGDEDQFGDIENLRAPWADRSRTVPSVATEAQLEARREAQRSTQLALDERHRRAVIALQG